MAGESGKSLSLTNGICWSKVAIVLHLGLSMLPVVVPSIIVPFGNQVKSCEFLPLKSGEVVAVLLATMVLNGLMTLESCSLIPPPSLPAELLPIVELLIVVSSPANNPPALLVAVLFETVNLSSSKFRRCYFNTATILCRIALIVQFVTVVTPLPEMPPPLFVAWLLIIANCWRSNCHHCFANRRH